MSSPDLRPESPPRLSLSRLDWIVLLVLSGIAFVLLVSVHPRYGFHGDELYFIACGKAPAFGYVDHPAFVPLLSRVFGELSDYSLRGVRLPAALSIALSVFLTGLLARRLGGGTFAVFVAAFSILATPAYLRAGSMLCIPCFEIPFWLLFAHALVGILGQRRNSDWIVLGLLVGLSFHNKHTTVFFVIGLLAGLLLTSERRLLATRWPWLAALIAFAIFLPNLIWQASHDWATWEFVRNLNRNVMSRVPAEEFLIGQILFFNPAGAVVWLAGLGYFLFARESKPFRVLGWIYPTVLVLLVVAKSKIYYSAPAYPLLLAGGAVALERFGSTPVRRWVSRAVPTLQAALALLFLPVVLPFSSIPQTEAYTQSVLGSAVPDPEPITEDFRAQTGWPELVQAVASVFHQLSEEEQRNCAILGRSYSYSAAVDFYGPGLGLPASISGHNNYFLWGPRGELPGTVIGVGFPVERLAAACEEVTLAATFENPLGRKYEREVPITICRKPKGTLDEAWTTLKSYD
ncbi:MAG: hypothetical protein GHCLOJNM_03866 [bacterium]|nr:hypothetical protein [bacterium]